MMLAGPAEGMGFILATVFAPGIALLVIAGSRFAKWTRVDVGRLRRIEHGLGLTFVLATGLLCLYLLPVLTSGPRSGGLGSIGDPLGAFLMLGYVFVLAPFAVVTSAVLGFLHIVLWRRSKHRR
jgi:hypothetical protein